MTRLKVEWHPTPPTPLPPSLEAFGFLFVSALPLGYCGHPRPGASPQRRQAAGDAEAVLNSEAEEDWGHKLYGL